MKPASAAMCLPGRFGSSAISANRPKAGLDNRTTASAGKMRLVWRTWNCMKPDFSLPGSPGMMPEIAKKTSTPINPSRTFGKGVKDECAEYRNVSRTVDIRISGETRGKTGRYRYIRIAVYPLCCHCAGGIFTSGDNILRDALGYECRDSIRFAGRGNRFPAWHTVCRIPQKCPCFGIPEIQAGNRVRTVAGVPGNIFPFVIRT